MDIYSGLEGNEAFDEIKEIKSDPENSEDEIRLSRTMISYEGLFAFGLFQVVQI